jgi:outer membrane protein TolC
MRRYTSRVWYRMSRGAVAGLLLLAGCQLFLDDADRQVYKLIDTRQKEAIGATSDARLPRPIASTGQRDPFGADESRYDFVPNPVDNEVPEAFQRPAVEFPTTQPSETPSTRPAEIPATRSAESLPTHSRRVATSRPLRLPEGPTGQIPLDDVAIPDEHGAETGPPPTLPSVRAAPPTTSPATQVLTLADSLAYAFAHSWDFQTAKETLYLSALDLTLERHLWGPILFANLGSDYTNLGKANNFDQSLQSVMEAGVRQKLPYGGEIVARTIDNLLSDLRDRAIDGATGQMLLEGNVPLLRGAGKSAYETRYQAERNLIYAVRRFENVRRDLAVAIAGSYFNLQQLRQQITNAQASIKSFELEVGRTRALWRIGRYIRLDVQRAEQNVLGAQNAEVDAVEAYQAALDRFKILIGMPMETAIDVPFPAEPTGGAEGVAQNRMEPLAAALRMPDVSDAEAVRTALKYRLELINSYDLIGDAERGVAIAENNLLPDFNATGSIAWDTNPNYRQLFNYNTDRVTYKAGMTLEVPLERTKERNALRRSFITKAQAERNYVQLRDDIIRQVRQAERVVVQQQQSLQIQLLNRDLALRRRQAAEVQARLGKFSNRDVVEAEQVLLDARNRLAQAQAQLSLAILEFRRATGTLRINNEGRWTGPEAGTN